MSRILITNGDHAANALAAHFPDAEILIWRDVLVEGPVPGGIDDEALADIRARYIEDAFGMQDVRADFARRDEAFQRIKPEDRVELWFETDLHDQLQLIQILARFEASKVIPELWLTVAAPPMIQHIDRMAESLTRVSPAHLDEGAELWFTFRRKDPEALWEVADVEQVIPGARAAMYRLLGEFPGAQDGLSRIERYALLAIRDGAIAPALAFRHYQQTEPLPFLGDLGFFHRLDALAFARHPLIRGIPEGGIAEASRTKRMLEYAHAQIELTAVGHEVLEAKADFVKLNGVDRWVGGVHLNGLNVWRR